MQARQGEAIKKMLKKTMLLLAAGLWISIHAEASRQQDGISPDKNRAVVVRANSRISVDGSLKDTDWERAQLIGEIMQREG